MIGGSACSKRNIFVGGHFDSSPIIIQLEGSHHQYLFKVMVPSVLLVVVVQGWRRKVRARVLLIRRGEGFMIALLHCNRGLSALCHLQPGNVCVPWVMEGPVWRGTSGSRGRRTTRGNSGSWEEGDGVGVKGSTGHGMIWSSRYDVVVKSDGFHQTRAEGHEQKEKNIKTMKKQSNGKHESSQRNRFERVRILKIKD